MNTGFNRRVTVATCWATSRISVLDSIESYEDSYAITQEFREWITCSGENSAMLSSSVLGVPRFTGQHQLMEWKDGTDEPVEI